MRSGSGNWSLLQATVVVSSSNARAVLDRTFGLIARAPPGARKGLREARDCAKCPKIDGSLKYPGSVEPRGLEKSPPVSESIRLK